MYLLRKHKDNKNNRFNISQFHKETLASSRVIILEY